MRHPAAPMNFSAPEIKSVGVTLTGIFNPAILHPAWFASEQLIRKGEAEEAENVFVTKDLVAFRLDWLALQGNAKQIDFYCEDAGSFDQIRDLVVGTFRLLSHTPVETLSIIYHTHYRAESEEEWHRVGNTVAPKPIYEGLLKKPGLINLHLEGQRDDGHKGKIYLFVQPSALVTPGVYLAVQDAFDFRTDDESRIQGGSAKAVDILTSNWASSMEQGRLIIESILKRI